MTPEQFLEMARVLPEPLLYVTDQCEVLSLNQGVAKLLGYSRKELRDKTLWDLVTDEREVVLAYLKRCAQSRQLMLGSLTFRQAQGEPLSCRVEGAVMQPKGGDNPAFLLLRLEARAEAIGDFVLLNHKIDELSREIIQRQQVEKQLLAKNQEVETALRELRSTQIQLIQTEKMSSLGQLVAGIAHEINNPVSFIHGNLNHVEQYLGDLLRLFQLYQQEYPHPSPRITAYQEIIDFQFLLEDADDLLRSMRMGTKRIMEIVKSLRNFSRLDESASKAVDIHEGIESTLVILKSRLQDQGNHDAINIVRDYGELPPVDCYPGPLNQVLMNLISNAIDALREKATHPPGRRCAPQIRIQTERLNQDAVMITIHDNGSGIEEAVRSHIFDPFFTTKPVGKGTGLGLSISYQIITDLHQGCITCDSKPGQGTIFRIALPISQGTPLPVKTCEYSVA